MGILADHLSFGGRTPEKVPNAKQPKIRPPRGYRDRIYFPVRSLPSYTGPYPVGTMEIEVPVQNPCSFSHITRHGRHVLQLETVLMTVYYPTSHTDYKLQRKDPRFSRELWLGRPRWKMACGYSEFGGVSAIGAPLFLPTLFTKLPAYRNAPIASHWAPSVNLKTSGPAAKVESGTKPEGAPHDPVFPLIMFSHGLGGTRTMYSSVCGEYASYGFVVCAVEHRDGSGPRTYVNHPKSGEGSMEDCEERGGIDYSAKDKQRGYEIIDYLWPKDNPKDTMPNNTKGVDTELRNAQINLRMAELEEAYHVMCEIVKGNGQLIADRNLRRKGFKASSSHGLEGVNWPRWKDRIHLDHVTICGHSFGGATAVEILRHDDRFNYITQGIIYDIWGAGTRPPEEEAPDHRIHSPVLAINSEAFTYWTSNYELVESLVEEAQGPRHSAPSWLVTLRGTVHVSQSDFSLLYPNVCSLLLKMVANPRRALDININISLEFLSLVLPPDLAQVNRAFQNENFLETDVSPLSRIPTSDKHKPNEEWIAMRLKIEHEWLYRINPKWARKIYRKHIERKQERLPDPSSEIWLHIKPSDQLLLRHRCEMEGRPIPELMTPANMYVDEDGMRFDAIHTPRKEEVEYSGLEEVE